MNKSNIINGQVIAQEKNQQLKQLISELPEELSLATILVGDDAPSHIYVNAKINASKAVGIIPKPIFLQEHISEEELINIIHQLNQDKSVHGILVQLPLPSHINTNLILEQVSPDKDVDGFHPYNIGNLSAGISNFAPATATGVIMLLEGLAPNWSIESKNAVVIGASNIVGKPTASLLLSKGATVTIAHDKTKDLKKICQDADLIVVAVGHPNLITTDMIKEGAVVIDVGINRLESGKLVGDVDFENVKEKACFITPVPGGVGPMTIHALMQNCYDLYKQHKG